jgi:CRISPR/Cas system CMR-associated protein Cmr5 small subunit
MIHSVQFSQDDFQDLYSSYCRLLPSTNFLIPQKGCFIIKSDGHLYKINQVDYITNNYEMFVSKVHISPHVEGDIIVVESNNNVFQVKSGKYIKISPKQLLELYDRRLSNLEKYIHQKVDSIQSSIDSLVSIIPESIDSIDSIV